MDLILPSAPPQSVDALRSVVPALASSTLMIAAAPKLAATLADPDRVAQVSPASSYRIYTLGLSDLVSAPPGDLSASQIAAWRHTFVADGESVAADVATDDAGATHSFSALRTGQAVTSFQEQLDALRASDGQAGTSFDVALLQIPALGVRAVWLHDPANRVADVLVPVAPVRAELTAGKHYSAQEFMSALKDPAALLLAEDDPRKGSG